MSRPGRVVVVTGTSTGVGKTVVTAALSSVLAGQGEQIVVVKPVQTGIADGDCDADEVHRLTGCAVQEHAALDEFGHYGAGRGAGRRLDRRRCADRLGGKHGAGRARGIRSARGAPVRRYLYQPSGASKLTAVALR